MTEKMELTEEFLKEGFNVEAYARKLLKENASVAEQLSMLASNTASLDRQLKEQISTHHEQLLSQATSIESLEDVLNVLNQHISALQSSVGRACEKVCDLYRKTETRTIQLQRLHEACTMLRDIIRVLQLSARVAANNKDIVKGSAALQELREVCAESDLRGVKVVEKELAAVQKLTNDMVLLARSSLKQGLKAQQHSQVGAALQAFYNLKCVDPQLNAFSVELFEEARQILKSFGSISSGSSVSPAVVAEDGRSPSGPGSASIRHVPSSVVIRANFWNDVNRLVEHLMSVATQLQVLNIVAAKKRESSTHRLFSELIVEEFYSEFWRKMSESLKETFQNADILVKQTFESEYPRLLRSMASVFLKISQQENVNAEARGELRSALYPMETAYLSKSLARLFDVVNLAFSSEQRATPTRAEVDNIVQTIGNELNSTKFDDVLFDQTCRNISKTLKLFAVKCEQLLITDGEASQIFGISSAGQKQNIDVVNILHYLRTDMQQFLASDESASSAMRDALDNLVNLMAAAVNPLLLSFEDSLSAIIVTLHQENFAFDASDERQQQCSLYVRELQDFVSRVWRDHLSAFECRDFIYAQTTTVARKAFRLFLIHVSLVRPLREGGRLRLAADFAQFELALNPLCRRLSDAGDVYSTFKAFRPLLFQTPEEIVANGQLGRSLPYSLIIHLLISLSDAELQSPHVTAGWSLTRYADWLEDHQAEQERLQFLRGTLEAYARVVQTEGRTSYVPTYPLLLETLKHGFEFNK